MKRYLWGILYAVLLTGFTAYVLLDTFVIPREYITAPVKEETASADEPSVSAPSPDTAESEESEMTEAPAETEKVTETEKSVETDDILYTEPVITENSYTDGNISIQITEYREYNTTIYVADIRLSSADYLKTAFAKGVYGKNVTKKTSEMAADNGAILAINGDYYGSQERGYVLRNGVLYRSTADKNQEDLVIYSDGAFEIITESNISADTLFQNGARQILSFGPALITDGAISVTKNEEVGKAMASNPRTAIGIIDDLHYVFVVSDGRTGESKGLSLYELAEFMRSLNVSTAYNLDGGGSSTMVFNGKIINNPTTGGKKISERSVSDIVYIGY